MRAGLLACQPLGHYTTMQHVGLPSQPDTWCMALPHDARCCRQQWQIVKEHTAQVRHMLCLRSHPTWTGREGLPMAPWGLCSRFYSCIAVNTANQALLACIYMRCLLSLCCCCCPYWCAQVYPATLFTSAPLPLLREALKAATAATPAATTDAAEGTAEAGNQCSSSIASGGGLVSQQLPFLDAQAAAVAVSSPHSIGHANSYSSLHTVTGKAAAAAEPSCSVPLLTCVNLSVSTPAGMSIVRDLTLSLSLQSSVFAAAAAAEARGSCSVASLLIRGPSGCGKTTLLKCLAGLWTADCGRFSLPAGTTAAAWQSTHVPSSFAAGGAGDDGTGRSSVGTLFLPQRMLAAPGQTLRAQLAYPAAGAAFACCCRGGCSSRSGGLSMCRSTEATCWSSCSGSNLATRRTSGPNTAMPQHHQHPCQQHQQHQQPLPVRLATWWEDWLSCGIKWPAKQQRRVQQQLQSKCVAQCQHEQEPLLALNKMQQQVLSRDEQCGQLESGSSAPAAAGGKAATMGGGLCCACQQLYAALQQVGLSHLLDVLPAGLDSTAEDWGTVLSPGEMQRLGFARVLLQKPLLAVLDEATSSLPGDVAVQLYQQLQRAGVSYVSVGHSSSLLAVHGQVLTLAADGTGAWQLQCL